MESTRNSGARNLSVVVESLTRSGTKDEDVGDSADLAALVASSQLLRGPCPQSSELSDTDQKLLEAIAALGLRAHQSLKCSAQAFEASSAQAFEHSPLPGNDHSLSV
jgi:hypothetical protein